MVCTRLKQCRRHVWLLVVVWWMLLIRMLYNSVPNDKRPEHQQQPAPQMLPQSEDLPQLGKDQLGKIQSLKDQLGNNQLGKDQPLKSQLAKHPPVEVIRPSQGPPDKCPARITTMLKKASFNHCKGQPKKCSFTCLDVVNGDRSKLSKANEVKDVIMSDKKLASVASVCDNLFAVGKYVNEVGSEEELNFPLAYSILVYKDAGQVELLLRTIYQPNNAYCFHIDQKASAEFKGAMEKMVKCFPNVIISSRSVRVVYAGFSRLYADILCMKDLLQSPHRWKYLINLAGTAMPLKTNWEMVQVLSLYDGSNDIEGLPLNRTIHERFSHKWMVTNSSSVKHNSMSKTNVTKSPPPHDLNIVRGSAYGAFTRAFVEHVLSDTVAKDLLEWSMDTYSPDEHYWATLHYLYYNPQLHTPGGYKGPAESGSWISSYSSWPMEEPCLGLSTSKTSPCVLGLYHIPKLTTRPELFANKFNINFDPLAQVCLSSLIQLRTSCQTSFNVSHYNNFSFVRDKYLSQH